jgi:hypothetical protein
MTIQLFTNVITLGNDFIPMAKGVGSTRVMWLTAKARTNGFTIASTSNAVDGYKIAASGSIDIPVFGGVGNVGTFSLGNLYWANTVVDANAIIELIGMRDI